MFLHLNHQKLEVYTIARQFVKECYFATNKFPAEEKYAMTHMFRRAALSVHFNIAEGSSRKSETERRRYYEIARGSIIEVDAALDIACDLDYCTADNLQPLGLTLVKCFKYLSGLINA